MEKKKWEKFKAEQRRKPKRKPDDDDNLPTGLKRQPKKRTRMGNCKEVYDMQEWWRWAEERCMRAGELRARLENDKRRVLRWMENREHDMILKDGPGWWQLTTAWAGGSEVSETGVNIGVTSLNLDFTRNPWLAEGLFWQDQQDQLLKNEPS